MGKNSRRKRKSCSAFLLISIASTVAILFIFKYFNFFAENINFIAKFFGSGDYIDKWGLILPIGLSFHTFQSLSYVIEVYRKKQKAEHNFGIYALYVMFYPQLVAGPIERPQNLLHQFYEKHKVDLNGIVDGLRLMLWGFFKKVVIADRLAIVVNTVYSRPEDYSGWPLIIATIFFAFQIYCDFSGYSDIALGTARVMGFNLMRNFNRPYLSKSIAEFWRRWHISLSTWFRDYVYIPLGGNKSTLSKWCCNTFTVFLISGLWHGASWTFIIWGALHGFYLVFSSLTEKYRSKLAKITGLESFPLVRNMFKICATFVFVCFGWIFFRANSINDAIYIMAHLFSDLNLKMGGVNIGMDLNAFIVAIALIFILKITHLLEEYSNLIIFLSKKPIYVRGTIYIVVILLILLFGIFKNNPFIYFQF